MTMRYLSCAELAERIGVSRSALGRYKLPEPDAITGTVRGWLPETVDAWHGQRPGRGRGAGRPRKHPA
jgi:predicted DNA-binding transcriptional regulator AlpA